MRTVERTNEVNLTKIPFHQVLREDGTLVERTYLNLEFEFMKELMHKMVFTRQWDERAIKLSRQGRIGFHAPVSGQEAAMIGTEAAMNREDFIVPAYREMPTLYWHGYPMHQLFLYSLGHQQGGNIPKDVHCFVPQVIIGAQIVEAVGVGLAFNLKKEPRVAITYIGDGGTSQGDFYEGLNFAGALNAPVVFVVQNNGYAISVSREKQTKAKTLAQKAVAAGIEGIQVDGMDVLAVYDVMKEALDRARSGRGPTLIEAVNYRFLPHTLSGDDPSRYRNSEEEEHWRKKDPLIRMRKFLTVSSYWTEQDENNAIECANEAVQKAIELVEKTPEMTHDDLINFVFEKPTPQLIAQRKEFK
ncbi:pyruvate dehydrogenase (acetyl-transferring) E1 component subunit alpha [Alicyclobacillus fodiniaquatilis]|uniref:Pyruvate dehydrogenase E1 component subunit alpha n=1 Tax=Alicyclobacillus fodiniaquatilis TaxID=1661150 RepID=A0ABW4JJ88_9BACL